MINEYHDGGYWYVVPVVTDDDGGQSVDVPASDWLAWYYGDVALVRTTAPLVDVITADVAVSELAADLPFGRIGGE